MNSPIVLPVYISSRVNLDQSHTVDSLFNMLLIVRMWISGGFVFVQLLSKWSPVTWCFIGRSSPLTWKAETVVLVNKMSLCVCWTVCVIYVCNGHSRPFECFFIQVHKDFCGLTQISWIVKDFFDGLLWHAHRWLNNWPLVVGKKRRKMILWLITIDSSVILNWFLRCYDVCCQFHTNKLHCEKPRILLEIATLTMCGKIFSVDGIDNLQ